MSSTRRREATVAAETASVPVTPIGIDVGEKTLVAAATASMEPADAFAVEGHDPARLFDYLATAVGALQSAGFETDAGEAQLTAAFWYRLRAQVLDAAARTVQWVRSHSAPVLVLEDLGRRQRPLWAVRDDAEQVGAWLLPHLQSALAGRAREAGVPVAYVDPDGTSRECHRCGEHGEREKQRFWCTNPDCDVRGVDADRSAAITIASRAEVDIRD
ncbi:zinc ribbon domain-containing protein [Halopelagius inordinatus]|uniref:zinc ribbon domain-containing protein n=1 Tax=Halopelagius inordinatus TaxID=553467 RepID=UPI0015A50A1E|nr:zinc ribbon domain-containing protein [Halopelagius inordinatus]